MTDPSETVISETPPGTDSSSETDDEDYALLKRLASVDFEDRKQEKYEGTGFTYSDVFALHRCEWDPSYPECPQRILESIKRCRDMRLVERCKQIDVSYATMDRLLTKHSREHVELAERTATMTPEEQKELARKYDSWYCNKHTYEAALASAGSSVNMAECIINGEVTNGFAMVRPPGHHAQETDFNGYCTFNNLALTAQAALEKGLERILIVDWDVHHGQGIQQMFYDDPRVLYISIHRYEHGEFWPNLRESDYDYIGKDKGKGFNVNIPLNKIGMTNADYLSILHQLILPLAYELSPQLVLLSSGYDAALGCPEGEMLLTPVMYAHMTHHLMALAAGRVCVCLEGGYCVETMAEGCALTLRALLLDPCPILTDTGEPSDSITSTILNVVKVLRPHWNCFSYYKTSSRSQQCPFEDVNSMPPVSGIQFDTPENRPENYDLQTYPDPDSSEKQKLASIIKDVINGTDLSLADTRCSFVFDADMRAHKLDSHPERPDRISAIYTRLTELKLLKRLLSVPSRLARKSELLWIHSEEYIQDLVVSQTMGDEELDVYPLQKRYMSIYMNKKSVHCALLSCGSVLNLVEAILTKQTQSGVAIVRPPGHHAECSKAMGFCFFNNVAVAARLAQHEFGLKRILIVDWDVHHGNATQHQFYDDPSVLYISLHRFDNGSFFPCSEDARFDKCGEGSGLGYNVNISWSNGRMGDAEYISAFTQVVMPIAYQFNPELVLVSAGFDAAVGDPLGGYRVSPAGFGHMTHMLMGLANGRVALLLEGGYNLNSISESMAVCTSVLLGEPCPMLESMVPCPSAAATLWDVMETQKQHWSCLKSKVVVPSIRQVESQRWEKEQSALDERLALTSCNKSPPNKAVHSSCVDENGPPNDGVSSSVDASAAFTVGSANNPSGAIPTSSSSSLQTASQPYQHNDDISSSPTPFNTEASAISTIAGGLAEVTLTGPNTTPPLTADAATTPLSFTEVKREEAPCTVQQLLATKSLNGQQNALGHSTAENTPAAVNGEDVGVRPKVMPTTFRSPKKVSFQSTLPRIQEPDPDPLSIFAGSGLGNLEDSASCNGNRDDKDCTNNLEQQTATGVTDMEAGSSNSGAGAAADAGPGPSSSAEEAEAENGACGVQRRPNTVEEFLQIPGAQQMFAVTPLTWCEHLKEVKPVPPKGLDSRAACETCRDPSENWVCLTCYKVECSRYVNEHMLYHRLESEHNMVLSYSDISVWCFACDSYIDNPALIWAKNAAHKSKFGEALANMA